MSKGWEEWRAEIRRKGVQENAQIIQIVRGGKCISLLVFKYGFNTWYVILCDFVAVFSSLRQASISLLFILGLRFKALTLLLSNAF